MGGETGQFVQNVTGNQHRDLSFPVQPQDQFTDFDDPLRVKSVDRLVQYQKIRISRKRNGNSQPLLHAERKVLRFFLTGVCKTDQFEKLRDSII